VLHPEANTNLTSREASKRALLLLVAAALPVTDAEKDVIEEPSF
jgi:hypothetical protein